MQGEGAIIVGADEHPLADDLTIGRGAGNTVRLQSRTVSRRHARLVYNGERWCIEDCGSANGTWVNDVRVPFGIEHPLRHGDRITVGSEKLAFSWPADASDPDRTDELEAEDVPLELVLSPFQLQVLRALCGAWVGAELDSLPTNDQIAASLGTPNARDSVKAALRRVYAKAGISHLPTHAKRRALCRIARQRGWV
jgi:pSer/pThr/pTyr-binding forkhead associated (FHA) protein